MLAAGCGRVGFDPSIDRPDAVSEPFTAPTMIIPISRGIVSGGCKAAGDGSLLAALGMVGLIGLVRPRRCGRV